jgi:hypothetical protein
MDIALPVIRTLDNRPWDCIARLKEELLLNICCTGYHKKEQDDNSPNKYSGFEILTAVQKVKNTP